jgi:hypothetical protein
MMQIRLELRFTAKKEEKKYFSIIQVCEGQIAKKLVEIL